MSGRVWLVAVLGLAVVPAGVMLGQTQTTGTTSTSNVTGTTSTTTTTAVGRMSPSKLAEQEAEHDREQSLALQAANNPNKMDVNTASLRDLETLPGVGEAYAQRIVRSLPFQNKAQLATRGIVPQATYDRIKYMIVARR